MTIQSDVFRLLKRAAAVVALALLCVAPVRAQEANAEAVDALETIRAALATGNAAQLVAHGADRIGISIFGTSELLSRSQALYVLKSFLTEYPPVEVEFFDTSSSEGNRFASAGYWHGAGSAPLTVYIRLRQGASGWELRELRIDRSTAR